MCTSLYFIRFISCIFNENNLKNLLMINLLVQNLKKKICEMYYLSAFIKTLFSVHNNIPYLMKEIYIYT